MAALVQILRDAWQIKSLPTARINLMYSRSNEGHPFYQELTRGFFTDSRRRHPRLPFMERFSVGVALCRLPSSFDEYFAEIEASARRNVKKARRLGYEFRRIDYNQHRREIAEIRRSAEVRQGPMPDGFTTREVGLCRNPPTDGRLHDYPYFGVLKEGVLYAYAGCLICGEVCVLEHIYGHAARQPDGVVPMLITGIAENLIAERPSVRFFCYGTFFGAGVTLRRFKRKFLFQPHRVQWVLG